MSLIYVKPAEGLLLRDEYSGQHIPAEGAHVKDTTLTQRRLARGELVKADEPRSSQKKTSTNSEDAK
jgi:Protein of unknown function (DUF2635)